MHARASAVPTTFVALALVASLAAGPARADSHESAPTQPAAESAPAAPPPEVDYRESEHNPGWVKKSWDLVFMRPFDLVGLGVGAVFWVIAYPVARVAGGTDEVQEACIRFPYERTFERPLGAL